MSQGPRLEKARWPFQKHGLPRSPLQVNNRRKVCEEAQCELYRRAVFLALSRLQGGKAIPQNKAATGNLNEKVVVGNMAEGETPETDPGSAPSPVEVEVFDPRGDLTLLVGQEGKVAFLVCSRPLAHFSSWSEGSSLQIRHHTTSSV
jgi:hypothetical protein